MAEAWSGPHQPDSGELVKPSHKLCVSAACCMALGDEADSGVAPSHGRNTRGRTSLDVYLDPTEDALPAGNPGSSTAVSTRDVAPLTESAVTRDVYGRQPPPADHRPNERPRTIVSATDGLPIRHDENESLSEDC